MDNPEENRLPSEVRVDINLDQKPSIPSILDHRSEEVRIASNIHIYIYVNMNFYP